MWKHSILSWIAEIKPLYSNFLCYSERTLDNRGVNAKARFSVYVEGFNPFLRKLKVSTINW